MTEKPKTIWLVGGGTGGHVVPLLAVAEALERYHDIKLYFVGETSGREASLIKQSKIPFLAISTGKFRRYLTIGSVLLNLRDIFRIIKGLGESYRLIRAQRPALIFSKGGAAALPVACAAWLTHVPIVTHESDAVIGMTNRILAQFAQVVLTSFPASVYPARYASKLRSVGLPLRSEFCRGIKKSPLSRRPMVLITGGSQGALPINQAVEMILPQLLTHTSVMHITGECSYDHFRNLKDKLPSKLSEYYGVIDFTPDIAHYMREASVVVTRSSSTIFELASLHKPMILIPLPHAANDHQRKNAEIFVQHHAALMLLQGNLTPESLYETIKNVLEDRTLQEGLQKGTYHFESCGAARRVAEILREIIAQ